MKYLLMLLTLVFVSCNSATNSKTSPSNDIGGEVDQNIEKMKNKVIIITGASSGIGEACAMAYAQKGSKIVLAARNLEKLKAVEQKIIATGSEVIAVRCDVSISQDCENLIEQTVAKFGAIDVLINNAGLLINKPITSMLDMDFDRIFDINVKSAFRLIRDLLPYLNSGAHVVNISSMGGVQGSSKFPGLSLYSASKGALAVLTECIAEELAEQRVFVNALALGAVQTEMLAQAFPGYQAPLQPNEMAGFIADFAKNGHRFFNGKILPVSLSTP